MGTQVEKMELLGSKKFIPQKRITGMKVNMITASTTIFQKQDSPYQKIESKRKEAAENVLRNRKENKAAKI